MSNLSFLPLLGLFIASAIVIWFAGVTLTKTTDTMDTRYKLGDALGGLIFLGVTGSLPEIAVVVGAGLAGHLDVIIGNLIGGIAIQTLVIFIFDLAVKGKRPLSYLAGSPILSIEAFMVVIITILALIGTKVPGQYNIAGFINPFSFIVAAAWLVGLYVINRARKIPRLNAVSLPDADPGRMHHERRAVENHVFYAKRSNSAVIVIFTIASLFTLLAGFLLQASGTALASDLGISAGIFAATFISLVTTLPEISSGLESILIGDNMLAFSDIFGGNAFMPAIFILGDLIARKSVLTFAGNQDILFAVLGIALTAVYGISMLKKPQNRILHLGIDSIVVILIYIGGIVLLQYIK